MKIVKVIHGYPMRYNAGSEVYSQTLCHGLANNQHDIHVFTREEDSFAPDYRIRIEQDQDDPRITVHLVNNPRNKDRYRSIEIDQKFAELLETVQPDIVHIGHLNHLSTSLVNEASIRNIPIIYTLHDYWLMCPRGQFMQMFSEDQSELWAACSGQDDQKCAASCYTRYFSGSEYEHEKDMRYWSDWVSRRMNQVREMTGLVDMFITPSRYLHDRYRDDFGLPERKLMYLDYGFPVDRMTGRNRKKGASFTFGYIGTHIPAKGIHDLIRAFGIMHGDIELLIWGRPKGQDTEALKMIAESLPKEIRARIKWLPEYRNDSIVRDVFDHVDVIVVPSIWVENSPLVIHEAQQARIPVITANIGGMAEYVHHDVNGLLFEHRSFTSLAEQMQRLADDPMLSKKLGDRGYLFSDDNNIPKIEEHVNYIENIYKSAIERRNATQIYAGNGPWRITFDTNPDTCNLNCIMCEEHSPHSQLQNIRRDSRKSHRLMPFELIEKMVADAVPRGLREIIPSTMGEPLLYKSFENILGLCSKYSIKLNLTTNGTFPGIGAKAWAEQIVPVTSDVKISWNGATKFTQEDIMVGSNWEEMLDNVKCFIEVRDSHVRNGGNRCRVSFQLTFIESNINELADIVKLAIDLGVDRVKGHHLWTHFDQIKELSMRRSNESIRRWNAAVLEAQRIAQEHTLPNGNHIILENIHVLDESATEDLAPGGPCPFLGQEAWISAEGRFDPCCAPDEQRRTLGEFGNLHEQALTNIWSSEQYQGLVASYRNHELCLGCNMRKPDKVLS